MEIARFRIRTLMIATAVVAAGCWAVVTGILPFPVLILAVCALLGIAWRTRQGGWHNWAPISGGTFGGGLGGVVLAVVLMVVLSERLTAQNAVSVILLLWLIGICVGLVVEICVKFIAAWARNMAKLEALRRRHD